MTIDTRINELIINKLTKAQYEAALEAGTISETEFYAVTDEDTYVDTNTFTNAMANKQDSINASNKLEASLVNGLATVATTGEYADLLNTPTVDQVYNGSSANAQSGAAVAGLIANYSTTDSFANVAFSGDFADLTNVPAAATVDQVYNGSSTNAQSGTAVAGLIANYSTTDSFANVAFNGEYADLLNKPELANVATSGEYADLLNKPELANVALSGDYADLTNTPTVDQVYNGSSANAQSGTAVAGLIANYMTSDEVTNAITNAISTVYKYKGSVATYADLPSSGQAVGDVWNVESDGHNYAWTGTEWDRLAGTVDLSNYVTLNTAQTLTNKTINIADNTINGLANVATTGEYSDLLNTPTLSTVAGTGEYSDLLNAPVLATVATTGEYSDLLNAPTVDTTYNASSANAQSGTAVANAISTATTNMQETTNMVDTISNTSTNTTYPTASAVYNATANLSGVVFRDWSAS